MLSLPKKKQYLKFIGLGILFLYLYGCAPVTQTVKRGELSAAKNYSIVPNIHMQLGCESCHLNRPKPDDKEATLLIPNNDVVGLCKSCHEEAEHHKGNIIPSSTVKVPDFLPLGKDGVSKGKVVCTTCHLTHAELAVKSLLRGFPQEANDKNAKFNKRSDLCDACHGQDIVP